MNLFDPTPRSALEFLPARHDLNSLRKAAKQCRGCDLYREAMQVVFGEGRVHAALLLVGEQPGDREDQQGKPFVGPAGQLLDNCLDSAGIDRTEVYVTNAVKHFKWEPRGKIRLHKQTIHLKLNELIHAVDKAKNRMIDVENLSDLELDELARTYEKIRTSAEQRHHASHDASPL